MKTEPRSVPVLVSTELPENLTVFFLPVEDDPGVGPDDDILVHYYSYFLLPNLCNFTTLLSCPALFC